MPSTCRQAAIQYYSHLDIYQATRQIAHCWVRYCLPKPSQQRICNGLTEYKSELWLAQAWFLGWPFHLNHLNPLQSSKVVI